MRVLSSMEESEEKTETKQPPSKKHKLDEELTDLEINSDINLRGS